MAKILVTMPDNFLSKVDGFAIAENRNRSDLIREALKSYMRKVSSTQAVSAPKNAEILEDLID